ncbi:hypothetical protein HPB50_010725 [Hyalomma asiaticum]|uniref:Uncharacterized protein n=1 Tax=Hyalomma asiaticum TaxID=266040 RepID=A0ACB7TG45_HYAAI|nr:hypothetical protein HPB50_010725 [Hyalomma asiaticum]
MDSGPASPKSVRSQRSTKSPKAHKSSKTHRQPRREKQLPGAASHTFKRFKTPKSPKDQGLSSQEEAPVAEHVDHLSSPSSAEWSQPKEARSADLNMSAANTPGDDKGVASPPVSSAPSTTAGHKSPSSAVGAQVLHGEETAVVHATDAPGEAVASTHGSGGAVHQAAKKTVKEERGTDEQAPKGNDGVQGKADEKHHQEDGVQGLVDQHGAHLHKDAQRPSSEEAKVPKSEHKIGSKTSGSVAQPGPSMADHVAGEKDKAPGFKGAAQRPAQGPPARIPSDLREFYARLASAPVPGGQGGLSPRQIARGPTTPGATTPGSMTSRPTGGATPGVSSVQEEATDRETKV